MTAAGEMQGTKICSVDVSGGKKKARIGTDAAEHRNHLAVFPPFKVYLQAGKGYFYSV